MFLAAIERYSQAILLLYERQFWLSVIGFLCVLLLSRLWKNQSSKSKSSVWLFFLGWMTLGFFSYVPGFLVGWQQSIRELWPSVSQNVLSLCSQSVSSLHRLPPVNFLPTVGWAALLVVLWLIFSAFIYWKLNKKRKRYIRIARSATELNHHETLLMMERWRVLLGIGRPITLRTSSDCDQVFTFGVRWPTIFIPRYLLEELEREEFNAVIGHELAHVARFDDVVVKLQSVLGAIFFLNPIFRVVNQFISDQRERCCDRLAMRKGNLSAERFGSSLLKVIKLRPQQDLTPGVVAGLGGSTLKPRILCLLEEERKFSSVPLLISATVLVFLSMMFGLVSVPKDKVEAFHILEKLDAVSPVAGGLMLNKPFAWQQSCVPSSLTFDSHYHPGLDFATPTGHSTNIVAVADGKVIDVFQRSSNHRVYIEHADGVVSSYFLLDNTLVQPGDVVKAGDAIARNSGMEHKFVHLEVHQYGQVMDPEYFVNR